MARGRRKLSDKQRRLLGALGILGGGIIGNKLAGRAKIASTVGNHGRALKLVGAGLGATFAGQAVGDRLLFSKRDKGIQKRVKSKTGRAVAGLLTGGPTGAALGAFGNRTFTGAKIHHGSRALFERKGKKGGRRKKRTVRRRR